MTFTIEHKVTFPQLDVLTDIYRVSSLILEKVTKMNADIQAFVDDVNSKIGTINANLTKINADTVGLQSKVTELEATIANSGTTLPDDAKAALEAVKTGLQSVVDQTSAIDSLVPDAQPPAGGDGSQV